VVRVLWTPPLELSADAWAWQVLAAVEEHAPVRIFIDALTDVQRVMVSPSRMSTFLAALTNELRSRGSTTMISNEIDAYTDDNLTVPVPAASATMDNGILLRHVEIQGHLRRLVTVLKVRQAASDPAIREMEITGDGIGVSRPFRAMSGLLTGRTAPDPTDGETAP
jgi:circadian clock protein KaiC